MIKYALVFATVVALAGAGAVRAQEYNVYHLPSGTTLPPTPDAAKFVADWARVLGAGSLPRDPKKIGRHDRMPDDFSNPDGTFHKNGTVTLPGGTVVHLYGAEAKQTAVVAIAVEDEQIDAIVALVEAETKASAARLNATARKLVFAFAGRLGRKGTKGYAPLDVVQAALDRFIAEIQTRGAATLKNEAVAKEFETKVGEITVKAGQFLGGNDTGDSLADAALALLPESLKN